MQCPLCRHSNPSFFFKDKYRSFHECPRCRLLFVPPDKYLSEEDEKARYDLHRNTYEDKGYVSFLQRIVTPVTRNVKLPARGMDFGSGPEPVLCGILSEHGYDMHAYDLYYARNNDVLSGDYDFITCCEVLEHIRNPAGALLDMLEGLGAGGNLFIMTQSPKGPDHFKGWSYKNDMTHICFYRAETFFWMAGEFGCQLSLEGNCVYRLIKD